MQSDETAQELRARVDALERSLREMEASNRRLLTHLALVDRRLIGIEHNRLFQLWGAAWRRVALLRGRSRRPEPGFADKAYRQWITQVESPAWANFTPTSGPCPPISVVAPNAAAFPESLAQQTYKNWEVPFGPGTSTGEYILFLNGSGVLAPYALDVMAQAAREYNADVVYGDEDHLDGAGGRSAPVFKPAWSPELLRSTPYVGAPLMIRRELLLSLGDGRSSPFGPDAYQLVLAAASRSDRIVHIPAVLFHRQGNGAPAVSSQSAAAHPEHPQTVGNELAIIVCSRNPKLLRRCLQSIASSAPARVQTIVVEHREGDPDPGMQRVLTEFGAVVVPYCGPFNFAAMNNAGASRATAPYLLFLNDDVIVSGHAWYVQLLDRLTQQDIGVVGSVLVYPGGAVQHAGIVLGIGDGVGHAGRFERETFLWPWLRISRDVSAVTGAFFGIRSQVFRELGGFDPAFPNNYNDVDFCLRARTAGFRVVCLGASNIIHEECRTRPGLTQLEERERLYSKWGNLLSRPDPYYSPNLAASERIALSHQPCSPFCLLSDGADIIAPWPLRYNPVGRKENVS